MSRYFYSGLSWKPKRQISLSISVTNKRKTNAQFSYSFSLNAHTPDVYSTGLPKSVPSSVQEKFMHGSYELVAPYSLGRAPWCVPCGSWQVRISTLQPLLRLHRPAVPEVTHTSVPLSLFWFRSGFFPFALGTWDPRVYKPLLYYITNYLSNFKQDALIAWFFLWVGRLEMV